MGLRTNLKSIFFITVAFLCFPRSLAQDSGDTWQRQISPVYANLTKVQKLSKDTLFVQSSKGILCKTSTVQWDFFLSKEDIEFDKIFIINSKQIYISQNTNYQESNLYFWNGNVWELKEHPIANTILSMCFLDKDNGIFTAYGEVVQLKNAQWNHLKPPINIGLSNLVVNDLDDFYVLAIGKGIYHYNKNWQLINLSENVHFIKKISNRIFVIGNDFLGELTNNDIRVISKDSIWKRINNLTIDKNNNITAVGNKGLIISYSNNKITYHKTKIQENLNDIISFNNKLFCVGDDGEILVNDVNQTELIKKQWKGFERIYFKQEAKVIDDEYGVVVADFNNDGFPDIFTSGLFEKEHLYIYNGSGFEDKAKDYGIIDKKNELNLGACAADIDNDGYIDLYVSVLNGKNTIYKNSNGTHFIDYSNISGGIGEITDRTNAAIFADVDNDGDVDVFIANEFSTNRLYLNNGVGIFSEITNDAGLVTEFGGNSATFGDIDNDGDVDLFVTNWSTKNKLYKNEFIESGKLFFRDITEDTPVGGTVFAKSNACVFSDIDNDADLDLFVTNRKTTNSLYINDGKGFFTNATNKLIIEDKDKSYAAVIGDFDLDGWKDIYISNVGKNIFYKNTNGSFKEIPQKFNTDVKGYSTGSAILDYDRDGDWDIYVSNYVGESSVLLKNKGTNKDNSIEIKLRGIKNNSNAIGTKIYVYDEEFKDSLIYYNEVNSGTGYVSMNELKQIIPIDNKRVTVKIVFPNGIQKEFKGVYKGTKMYIEDVEGYRKYKQLLIHFIKRQLLDPHRLFMLIKLLVIVIFLGLFTKKTLSVTHFSNLYLYLISFLLLGFYVVQNYYFEYQPILFSTFLPVVSIVILSLLLYYYFEKKYLKKQAVIKQNQIKIKLSRDLHDDLSATISSIGFYLAVTKLKLSERQSKLITVIKKAENLVQNASDSLTDLIWAINPKQEYLKNLIRRLQNNYSDIFNEKDIRFTFTWNATVSDKLLSVDTKQNCYLILKEAVNNTLKYAEATKIEINVKNHQNKLLLTIIDDGRGFDIKNADNKGHGLDNMAQRAQEIGTVLEIDTKLGKGTIISLII